MVCNLGQILDRACHPSRSRFLRTALLSQILIPVSNLSENCYLCILRSVWSDLIVNLGDEFLRNICRKTWQFGFEVDEEELLGGFRDGDLWRDAGALLDVETHAGSDGGEDLPQIVFYLIEGVEVVALAQWPNLDVNVRLGFDLAFHARSRLEGVWHKSERLSTALH